MGESGSDRDIRVLVVDDHPLVRTTLAELPRAMADEDIRPPAVWIVGQVVSLTTPQPAPTAKPNRPSAPGC